MTGSRTAISTAIGTAPLNALPISVVVLVAPTNRIESLTPLLPELLELLNALPHRRLSRIGDHRLELYAMAELCSRYGISRKTGYEWLARFDEGGRLGLRDRSRAPHHYPHRIAQTSPR
jgi:hypothetical protein